MYNFKKRIEVLEAAIKNQTRELSLHDPFVLLQPWCLILDQYQVFYYPEGMFRPPQKYGMLRFQEACALMAQWSGNLSCKISMGSCLEWLFVLHQIGDNSKLYTQEQLDRFANEDVEKYPQLAFLLETEDGRELVENLVRLPQCCKVQLKDLQNIIRQSKVE